ncbi:MAG TPA: hypothetical protein IAB62_14050 [Candidatus Coprocola pullicola]|nr:hypothetical protein [Candidatus Coprocola pullicola]
MMKEKNITNLLEVSDTDKILSNMIQQLLLEQTNAALIAKLKDTLLSLTNFTATFSAKEKQLLLKETNQLLSMLKVPFSLQTKEKLQQWIILFFKTLDEELLQKLHPIAELTAQTGEKPYMYKKELLYYTSLL